MVVSRYKWWIGLVETVLSSTSLTRIMNENANRLGNATNLTSCERSDTSAFSPSYARLRSEVSGFWFLNLFKGLNMSNVTKVSCGSENENFSNDLLPLTGAVLAVCQAKPQGVARMGILRDKGCIAALAAQGLTNEVKQMEAVSVSFKTLAAKGFITLSEGKVPNAMMNPARASMAQAVIEASKNVVCIPVVAAAKRGRPKGTGRVWGQSGAKSTLVKRNPKAVAKGVSRYWLDGETVTEFGRGRPSYEKLTHECDLAGKIIANVAKIPLPACKVPKTPAVKRSPGTPVFASARYYLLNGEPTPFGRGRPGEAKLCNECNVSGELLPTNPAPGAPKAAKVAKVAVQNAQVSALEAQVAQLTAMMAQFLSMQGVTVPQAQVAATQVAEAIETIAETVVPVEVKPEVVEVIKEAPKAPATRKAREKSAVAPKASNRKPKVLVAKNLEEMSDEDLDAAVSADSLDGYSIEHDDAPIGMDANGFVFCDD